MDFNTWIDEQDDDVKAMVAGHVDGLKSALDSERDARKRLATDLKTAVSSSANDGEMRSKLEKMTTDLAGATGRADFFAAGHKEGVTNLSLAYLAAQEGGFIGDDGADFKQLKGQYPELFSEQKRVPGNAGDGMNGGGPPDGKESMDSLIRQQAGVG